MYLKWIQITNIHQSKTRYRNDGIYSTAVKKVWFSTFFRGGSLPSLPHVVYKWYQTRPWLTFIQVCWIISESTHVPWLHIKKEKGWNQIDHPVLTQAPFLHCRKSLSVQLIWQSPLHNHLAIGVWIGKAVPRKTPNCLRVSWVWSCEHNYMPDNSWCHNSWRVSVPRAGHITREDDTVVPW